MSSGTLLKNRISLKVPLGPPSPLPPLSETTMTIVFSELPGLLEIVEDPPDLVVRVGDEAGKDLGHANEQSSVRPQRERPRAAQSRVSARAARPALWPRAPRAG